MWTNTVNDIMRRSRGGSRVFGTPPPPGKSQVLYVYRNKQMDPTSRKSFNTLEMLFRPPPGILENIGTTHVFSCINICRARGSCLYTRPLGLTKIPNKKVRIFSCQSGLSPPPHPTPNAKNSWIRAWVYIIVAVKKRYGS